MPTFEFADCLTRLDLSKPAASGEQTGSVTCGIRNTLSTRQAGRVRVEPDAGAKPEWFAVTGGLATSPLELEQDFAPGSAANVTVQVRVPSGAAAGPRTFKLRVTSEQKPDTDFAVGPTISFDVAAPAAPPVKAKVPIWAFAVSAVVVLLMIAGGAYLFWPKDPLDPRLVAGLTVEEAQKIAADNGYPGIGNQPGEAAGYAPGTVTDVRVGADGQPVLLTDPGVTIPTGLRGQNIVIAVQTLSGIGLIVTPAVAREAALDNNVVASVTPAEGAVVKLGETIVVAVNEKPGEGGGTVNFCARNPRACIMELQPQFQRRIELGTQMLQVPNQ